MKPYFKAVIKKTQKAVATLMYLCVFPWHHSLTASAASAKLNLAVPHVCGVGLTRQTNCIRPRIYEARGVCETSTSELVKEDRLESLTEFGKFYESRAQSRYRIARFLYKHI